LSRVYGYNRRQGQNNLFYSRERTDVGDREKENIEPKRRGGRE